MEVWKKLSIIFDENPLFVKDWENSGLWNEKRLKNGVKPSLLFSPNNEKFATDWNGLILSKMLWFILEIRGRAGRLEISTSSPNFSIFQVNF